MKKIIFIIIALTLLMSTLASAGIFGWIFNRENSVTGAQTVVEKSQKPIKRIIALPEKSISFRGAITPTTTIVYNQKIDLSKGVTATSTYNNEKATITITKTVELTNNERVKLDDGFWIAHVTSKGLAFTRAN